MDSDSWPWAYEYSQVNLDATCAPALGGVFVKLSIVYLTSTPGVLVIDSKVVVRKINVFFCLCMNSPNFGVTCDCLAPRREDGISTSAEFAAQPLRRRFVTLTAAQASHGQGESWSRLASAFSSVVQRMTLWMPAVTQNSRTKIFCLVCSFIDPLPFIPG